MLSRHADACYWIGRYVERAEASARMMDVHYHAALEAPNSSPFSPNTSQLWKSLLDIMGTYETFISRYESENDRAVFQFFIFDMENANSILSTWSRARENARSIREQIASEMWESLNISYMQLREWNVDGVIAMPHAFFRMVKDCSHLFQGILNRTMLMGETRDWLDSGRFLERANQTAKMLDVKYHVLIPENLISDHGSQQRLKTELDTHSWMAVLKSVSAFEMYRKTHQDGITPEHVVDFLVLNSQFPASVRHGIGRVEGCIKRISGNAGDAPKCEPEFLLGKLRADLTYASAEDIMEKGLHQFLNSVLDRSNAIGSAIRSTYLS